jgi:putative Holliday junction resolvase
MRFLGVDLGAKRIGLAVSDASGTLATPWQTVTAGATPRASATLVANLLTSDAAGEVFEPGTMSAIVVGLPHRLNGGATSLTKPALEFCEALSELTGLAVRTQDERLTSREAEARLAVREKDWRRRKAKLDAAAAAIILQDYLDAPRA